MPAFRLCSLNPLNPRPSLVRRNQADLVCWAFLALLARAVCQRLAALPLRTQEPRKIQVLDRQRAAGRIAAVDSANADARIGPGTNN